MACFVAKQVNDQNYANLPVVTGTQCKTKLYNVQKNGNGKIDKGNQSGGKAANLMR